MNPVPLQSRHHIRETEAAGETNKRIGGEERRKEGKRRARDDGEEERERVK